MSIKYAAAAITKITLHYTYTKLLFNQQFVKIIQRTITMLFFK